MYLSLGEAFQPTGERAKSPSGDLENDPFVMAPTDDNQQGFRLGKSKVTPFTNDNLKSRQPITTDNVRNWIPWNHGQLSAEVTSNMETYIRNEYDIWVHDYNKQPDEEHYQIFKRNFLKLLEDADDGEGGQKFFHMNQYGDMPRDEAQRELILLEAYSNWCIEYGKTQDAQKFEFFKVNLLQQIRNLNIDEEITLDENADKVASLSFYMDPLLKEERHATQRRFLKQAEQVSKRQKAFLRYQARRAGGFVRSRSSQIEDHRWYERASQPCFDQCQNRENSEFFR